MLCNTCLSIGFRPLDEWVHRTSDINDPANKAFAFVVPGSFDKPNILRWREGKDSVNAYYFHHSSGTTLIKSAFSGCHLCAVISFVLFAKSAILSEPELDVQTLSGGDAVEPVILRVSLSPGRSSWREDPECKQIRLYCGAHQAWLDVLPVPHGTSLAHTHVRLCGELEQAWEQDNIKPYLSTWSQLSLQLATSWHRDCLSTHDSCRVGTSLLPKRVIDVGITTTDQPVLVELSQPTHANYVILSHCWGNGRPVLPTKFNAADKIWSLPPLSEWEQTFQDAVTVTRCLNMRYLWIDAPCILQGDHLDWEAESVKMARYFQNAALCIHASRASSGTDGLFALRNPLLTYPHHLRLPPNKTSPAFDRLLCAGRGALLSYREVEPNLDDSPPSWRAWCLQEELLSPRMLSFGQKRIYWRCLSTSHSESRVGELVQATDTDEYFKDAEMHINISRYSLEWGGSHNPYYEAWYKFLRQFNIRNITYQTDILPAISGMAELFHSRLDNDTYLAGLWQRDIIDGLLWFTVRSSFGGRRSSMILPPKPSHNSSVSTPSWSWMNMAHEDFACGFYARRETFATTSICAQLVSTDIKLRNETRPFGLIDSGTLVFQAKCPILTVSPGIRNQKTSFFHHFLSPSTMSDRSPDPHLPATRMEMDPAEWTLQSQISRYQLIGQCDLDGSKPVFSRMKARRAGRPYVARFVDAFVSPHRTVDAFFLPLKTDQVEFGRVRTVGLVLVRTGAPRDGGPGEYYRRIGCGRFDLGTAAWRGCRLPVKEIRLI